MTNEARHMAGHVIRESGRRGEGKGKGKEKRKKKEQRRKGAGMAIPFKFLVSY